MQGARPQEYLAYFKAGQRGRWPAAARETTEWD
jgi:hypothetical protein